MATLAGNFVNASPIGDMTAFFLALDTTLLLQRPNGDVRELPLSNFFKAYKTLDKHPDEFIASFKFPLPVGQFNFEKVSKRTHLDIASVNSAMQLNVENGHITQAHVSAGGVAPIPLYAQKTSEWLHGKPINAQTVREANAILQEEIAPISDARGTSDYKRLLLRQLFYAHFLELFPNQINAQELLEKK
jgi:xanthine dehydrogenase small subunit